MQFGLKSQEGGRGGEGSNRTERLGCSSSAFGVEIEYFGLPLGVQGRKPIFLPTKVSLQLGCG